MFQEIKSKRVEGVISEIINQYAFDKQDDRPSR